MGAPEAMILDVGGLRTRVVREGSGDPVLVLHGWGASADAVAPIVRALAAEHDVIAPDLPGFGETEPPPEPWSSEEYRRFTLELLDRLGIERPSVVGHSFGGRVAIRLGAGHPERVGRLVLVDSAGIRPRRGLRWHRRIALARVGKAAARHGGAAGERLRQRIVGRVASADYLAAGALRPTLVRVVNEDLREHLPSVRAPTLLVWGGQDRDTPLADARLMERLIPDAGLVVFEDAGHYSYLDEPVRFARVVGHFLRPAP